jgi:hypothetical protein
MLKYVCFYSHVTTQRQWVDLADLLVSLQVLLVYMVCASRYMTSLLLCIMYSKTVHMLPRQPSRGTCRPNRLRLGAHACLRVCSRAFARAHLRMRMCAHVPTCMCACGHASDFVHLELDLSFYLLPVLHLKGSRIVPGARFKEVSKCSATCGLEPSLRLVLPKMTLNLIEHAESL